MTRYQKFLRAAIPLLTVCEMETRKGCLLAALLLILDDTHVLPQVNRSEDSVGKLIKQYQDWVYYDGAIPPFVVSAFTGQESLIPKFQ